MQTETQLTEIRIGKTFWDDHVSRGCLNEEGENGKDHEEDEYLVKETKTTKTLLLPKFQIHELLSDAWDYATRAFEEMPELVQSARGTSRAVLKQLGIPVK